VAEIFHYLPYFLQGALLTVLLTLVSFTLAFFIGLAAGIAKTYGPRPLGVVAQAYTTVVRGVPLLIIIFLLFYGLPLMFGMEPGPIAAGVIALSLNYGAYATEVFRGGIQAIPAGQMESARSLGFSRGLAFQRIILPQVIKHTIPPLGNIGIAMLKGSSLVAIIQLRELLRSAVLVVSFTNKPFTFYLMATVLYLMMTYVATRGLTLVERRSRVGD
jgi:cystine transport system permease protein